MESDAEVYLKGLEEKRGGKLAWRTFSTYYANNNGIVRDHGVFLYEINNHYWYEDFEHTAQIFGIPLRKSKNAEPYVKYESDFGPEDVKSIRTVTKKAATDYCKGYKKYEKLKPAGLFAKIFCQCVTEFALKDGTVLFFELMDKTLSNKINEAQALNKE
jgi:hypothetical protein